MLRCKIVEHELRKPEGSCKLDIARDMTPRAATNDHHAGGPDAAIRFARRVPVARLIREPGEKGEVLRAPRLAPRVEIEVSIKGVRIGAPGVARDGTASGEELIDASREH